LLTVNEDNVGRLDGSGSTVAAGNVSMEVRETFWNALPQQRELDRKWMHDPSRGDHRILILSGSRVRSLGPAPKSCSSQN
jgi:hypothetical protein